MANSNLFGYVRREETLKQAKKTARENAIRTAKQICENEWQHFIDSLAIDSTKGFAIDVSDKQIDDLYTKILGGVSKSMLISDIAIINIKER